MKKFSLYLLPFVFLSRAAFPQIQYDTVARQIVGPGCEWTKVVAPAIPWSINILKVDLRNPYIKLETVIANEKLVSGKEKTTSMAARRNYNRHWVVGAVNADFFNPDGSPTNIQVEQGELVRVDNGGYPAVAFTELASIFMGKPITVVRALYKGTNIVVSGVNTARAANQVFFYNRFAGNTTGTDSTGTELILRNLSPWYMNDTVLCVIDSVLFNMGSTPIPSGKGILSASGLSAAQFAAARKGDTLKLSFNSVPALRKINEMIGGHPVIVKNGAIAPLDSSDGFVLTRHPRTGIGVTADTSTLFLFTVDGRQAISKGVDLFEFARFMLKLGVYQGMNFDGGGSTTMVVRNEIKNSPSDPTGERWVANALLVISTAPQGEVAKIIVSPKTSKVFIGTQLQYSVIAYDQYYNPITALSAPVLFSLSKPSLGTITSTGGLFTAGSMADTGYIIASYGTLRDSAVIIVKPVGSLALLPEAAVTDSRKIIAFQLKVFDTDSIEVQYPSNLVAWKSSDTAVGNIDALGQFQGYRNGRTKITAAYSGLTDTATVDVEIGTGKTQIDSMESKQGWGLTGQNYDSTFTGFSLSQQYSTIGTSSFKIDYRFTYYNNMYNWLYLQKPFRFYGIPDTIAVDMRTDIAGHRIFFDCTDAMNQNVRIPCNKVATKPGIFESFPALFPITGSINYPLTLKSISLVLSSGRVQGQVYQGELYLDNLRIAYGVPSDAEEQLLNESAPRNFVVEPGFPNPCNPETKFVFTLPAGGDVEVSVFTMLGEEIHRETLTALPAGKNSHILRTASFPSGAYVYSLRFTGGSRSIRAAQKLLVVK